MPEGAQYQLVSTWGQHFPGAGGAVLCYMCQGALMPEGWRCSTRFCPQGCSTALGMGLSSWLCLPRDRTAVGIEGSAARSCIHRGAPLLRGEVGWRDAVQGSVHQGDALLRC